MKYIYKHIIGFIFLMVIALGSFSQVKFQASGPSVVEIGETFQVSFVVNGPGKNPTFPTLKDFNILSGPNASSSSSIQIINGNITRDISYTYTYYLSASKTGTFTITPATITVDNNKITSNSLEIQVIQGSNNHSTQTNQNSIPQNNNNQETEINSNNENLFVRVLTNKKSVYQGEQLVATINIYTRLNLVGFDKMKFPSYSGFWSDDISTPDQISLHRESVNGTIYNVGTLKKTILTPQKSGKLTIDPYELTCVVQQRVKSHGGFFDDFFGSYQRKKVSIKSPKVTINVKSLPHSNDTSFKSAVGNFTFNATIDNIEVKENEPITLTVKISGNGNLRLFDLPEVNLPPDFETYDPKETNNIKNSESGTHGTRTISYLFIPRHAGNFNLPPIKFTYFDIKSKQYKTLKSDMFAIKVNKGDGSKNQIITSTFTKEDIKYLGKDIHFIKQNIKNFYPKNFFKIDRWNFYLGYIISLILFILIIVLRRKQIKESADFARTKNKKAMKIAKKRLKLAEQYMKAKEKTKFYEALAKALMLLLADKLNIPLSDLTKEKAKAKLTEFKIDEALITNYFNLIETIEYQRYSPVGTDKSLNDFYKEAMNYIIQMNTKLK